MALSLIPQQQPEHRMHTVTIDEIISLAEMVDGRQPPLENYFSPTRKAHFVKDYIHYLNSSLLEAKNKKLDQNLYLVFVLSFQFIAPLLEIPTERELVLFYRILENRYEVEDLDINLHFSMGDREPMDPEAASSEKVIVGEEDALASFRDELENSYQGRRDVKEIVQKRLKHDGIESIKKWQQSKGLPELAEAFGRSIVIPSFFSFTDKKLVKFYRQSTLGISYEVDVPELEQV